MRRTVVALAAALTTLGLIATSANAQIVYSRQPQTSDAGFVTGLYVDVLGRQPSASEVQGWVAHLQDVGWDRTVLTNDFLAAAETELSLRGLPTRGYEPAVSPIVVQPQTVVPYVQPGYVYGPSWYGFGYGHRYWGGSRWYGYGRGGYGHGHHGEHR
jgi:hypothetical protein